MSDQLKRIVGPTSATFVAWQVMGGKGYRFASARSGQTRYRCYQCGKGVVFDIEDLSTQGLTLPGANPIDVSEVPADLVWELITAEPSTDGAGAQEKPLRLSFAPSPRTAAQLTRASLLMVPVFAAVLVACFAAEMLAAAVPRLLGLDAGELFLIQGGATGWAAAIVFALAIASPSLVGAGHAAAALRRGARWEAWLALAVNALLVVLVTYVFVEYIRTY